MELDSPSVQPTMELLFFCTTVLILIVSSVYILGLLAHGRRNLPPGPRPLPLVGNLLSLGALPHRSLARLAERHGPIMALRLGTVTTVVASSADAARDILQRHDAAFSGRFVLDGTHVSAHYTHSMVWLPASSPRWRALRKVCAGELFAPHRLDMHQSLRREKVQQLVSHVTELAREGTPVAVGGLAFTTALNLLSSTIFSTDLADLDDRHVKPGEFKAILAELNVTVGLPNLSDFIPEVAWLDLQGLRRRIEGLFHRLHAIMDEQIERHMLDRAATGDPTKKNFLDVLLDYRNTDDDKGFERQTLLSLLSDLFSAGTDTSSATVEWAMAELLLNPSSISGAPPAAKHHHAAQLSPSPRPNRRRKPLSTPRLAASPHPRSSHARAIATSTAAAAALQGRARCTAGGIALGRIPAFSGNGYPFGIKLIPSASSVHPAGHPDHGGLHRKLQSWTLMIHLGTAVSNWPERFRHGTKREYRTAPTSVLNAKSAHCIRLAIIVFASRVQFQCSSELKMLDGTGRSGVSARWEKETLMQGLQASPLTSLMLLGVTPVPRLQLI
ncbi:hypothetical protein ZWY2020_047591 [Hordeum vulgare]|nr:hypothetical protein ZWY2020_047591 [Hordeum vulgare]